VTPISNCRICKNELYGVWKLLDAPYGDLFQDKIDIAKSIPLNTLALARCKNCQLLQLSDPTDIDLQYRKYLYFTKNTNQLAEFYSDISDRLIGQYKLNSKSQVLDIGSNDGTFLKNFLDKKFMVIGIDPSTPACEHAASIGVPSINEYFTKDLIEKHSFRNESFSLISINYTLANIPNISEFIQNISLLMNEKTILSIVTGYHPDQFAINMFDYIGHDHLSYFTIQDFVQLAKLHALKILDVTRYEHKGGSIHIVLAKQENSYLPRGSVLQNIQREMWSEVGSDLPIFKMVENLTRSKTILKRFLVSNKNSKICGIGASISTSHLINEFQISGFLRFIYDDDIRKTGKFSPFYGIEVKSLSTLLEFDPNVVVILAWQHTNKLMNRLIEIGYRGLLVVPLPEFRIYYLEE